MANPSEQETLPVAPSKADMQLLFEVVGAGASLSRALTPKAAIKAGCRAEHRRLTEALEKFGMPHK